MDNFVFEIFPVRSLDQSVITTVWIGVIVVAFFNLRFGWTFSGIVVPGYLVPIIITRPITAGIILLESVLTYWIAWFLSDFLARRGFWCYVFGRDRFFIIIVCSIIVRITFDGFIFPELADVIERTLAIQYDFHNNFQSLGLIVNALIANFFWKSGIKKSLLPLLMNTLLTYLAVRYVLMVYTNFNIGTLEYMYEDIAVSFTSSPKTYIILIIVAFLASKLNLLYGWDFNGILVPSLIALQWYEPSKIAFTFLETFIIFLVASLLLKTSLFQNRTIEKASKVMLFFNISFAYRMILGYCLEEMAPSVKISDFFATGYLVATLMAVKIHEKNIMVRLSIVTFTTSLIAAIIGNVVGFLFFLVPTSDESQIEPKNFQLRKSQYSLQKTLERQLLTIHQNQFSPAKKLSIYQRKKFVQAMQQIMLYSKTQSEAHLEKAGILLREIDYRVTLLEERYLYLQASLSQKTGTFIFDMAAPNDLHLEVFSSLHDMKSRDAGIYLWKTMEWKSLAIVETESSSSYHQEFYEVFVNVLRMTTSSQANALHIESTIPADFNLAQLKKIIGEYQIVWQTSGGVLQQQKNCFIDVHVNRDICLEMLTRDLSFQNITTTSRDLKIWLEKQKQKIPKRGSNSYKKAQIAELLFFDKRIIVPLLKCIDQFDIEDKEFPHKCQLELLLIQKHLRILGYKMAWFKNSSDYLVIYEVNSKRRRNWGLYVFRLGVDSPFIIQNPNPLFANCSLEFSLDLFDNLNSRALFLSGSHPFTNNDGSSNLTDTQGKTSLFHLFYQTTLREVKEPLLVVQIRGLKLRPEIPLASETLFASSHGVTKQHRLSSLETSLLNFLRESQISVDLVDGSFEMAGYEINNVLQAKYLEQTTNKELSALWLSPLLHFRYKQRYDSQQRAQFRALGISTIETDLFQFLQNRGGNINFDVPQQFKKEIEKYLLFQDIIWLQKTLKNWKNFQFFRVVDKSSSKAFLVVYPSEQSIPFVVNLSLSPLQKIGKTFTCSREQKQIQNFIFSNFTWMRLQSAK